MVGNDIQVTLNADFQQLALTETATVTVPYTLTGDAGDTSTANLVVTVNGANDVPIANDDTGAMSENDAPTLFNVRLNDTLDVDHTALNNITIGTVTATGPAGDGITGADVTTAVVGNQVQITLGSDFQNLGAGETATIDVQYTLTGDQAGDTDTATLQVTVHRRQRRAGGRRFHLQRRQCRHRQHRAGGQRRQRRCARSDRPAEHHQRRPPGRRHRPRHAGEFPDDHGRHDQ